VADDLAAALVRELAAALPEPLNSELVDAIARVVIELGRDSHRVDRAGGRELLTVAEVASRLRVSPKWVYAHQHELGALRLGDGPKARLRFDARVIDAGLEQLDETAATTIHEETEIHARSNQRPRRRRLISRPLPR
jgi:hypothetical protein